jgi:uncharacterized protein YjbJ (UPF0337 family)
VARGRGLLEWQSDPREAYMNWDQLKGQWKQSKGKLREKWGKITDDDFEMIAGQRDQLIGVIQERYGIAKEEAQKQADTFVDGLAYNDANAQIREQQGTGKPEKKAAGR